MSELEPLPDDLRSLFDAEGESYPDDAAMRARVLRGIETSVAFAALAHAGAGSNAASAAAALGATTKTAIVVGLLSFGIGVGVGEWHGRSASDAQPSAPLVEIHAPTSAAPTAPPTLAPPTLAAAPDAGSLDFHALPVAPSLTVAPLPTPPGSGPTAPAGDRLAQEQALVDTARAALARGRAADALRAADEHATRFPGGKLAEERENLAIQALAFAGRRDEALARAARFHERYPGSLYGGALDALLKAPRPDGGAR